MTQSGNSANLPWAFSRAKSETTTPLLLCLQCSVWNPERRSSFERQRSSNMDSKERSVPANVPRPGQTPNCPPRWLTPLPKFPERAGSCEPLHPITMEHHYESQHTYTHSHGIERSYVRIPVADREPAKVGDALLPETRTCGKRPIQGSHTQR